LQLEAKIDPELIRQIGNGEIASSERPVEAVFRLHSEDPSMPVNSPEKTTELANEVLSRVKRRTGIEPVRVNVFRNLGSFVVAAKPSFLTELMAEPEIASAMANRQPTHAFIPPIRKRAVSISEIGTEVGHRAPLTKKSTKRGKTPKAK